MKMVMNNTKFRNGEIMQSKAGENHQLFGTKYLRLHNMRNEEWTAADKIKQYRELGTLYEKVNQGKDLLATTDIKEKKKNRKKIHFEIQKSRNYLKSVRFGDVNRNKFIFQNNPIQQRTFQFKKSSEIADAIEQKTFTIIKQLDQLRFEKKNLSKIYKIRLEELAHQQDLVKYYYKTEYKEEDQMKKLMVDLKTMETRGRAIKVVNKSYTKVIDRLLKDSLFYQPILDELADDITEQAFLIKNTCQIGLPAMEDANVLKREYEILDETIKKEITDRVANLEQNRKLLKQYAREEKKLVRSDSDFSFTPNRYARETNSMLEVKRAFDDVDRTINYLRRKTMSSDAEEVLRRVENQPKRNQDMLNRLQISEELRDDIVEKENFAKFARELLLDDMPQIYNDEHAEQIEELKNSIHGQKMKQEKYMEHTTKRGELVMSLRLAFQHMLDIFRHVGSPRVYKEREFPTADLKLSLLNFASPEEEEDNQEDPPVQKDDVEKLKIPEAPPVLEDDVEKLLGIIKSKVEILMKYYVKYKKDGEIEEKFIENYQKLMIKDMVKQFKVPVKEIDLDHDEYVKFVDPTILTHREVKTRGRKIQLQNAKQEDD